MNTSISYYYYMSSLTYIITHNFISYGSFADLWHYPLLTVSQVTDLDHWQPVNPIFKVSWHYP
jgi:hypothetical protein